MGNINRRVGCCLLVVLVIFTAAVIWFWNGGVGMGYAGQNENQRKIGSSYMTMNNPFFALLNENLRAEVESRGDILIVRDPALNQERQIEQVQEMISQGIDVLVLNPVDWEGVTPALEAAKEANVPVIIVDTPVKRNDLVACTVVSDNYNVGVVCAEHMMAKREKANIVLLEHLTTKASMDRIKGFTDTIEGHIKYKIVARANTIGQLEIAMPVMRSVIAKNVPIDVVMALNDPAALGAMAALQESGMLDGISVYGADGAPEAKKMIKEGLMTATAAQFPLKMAHTISEKTYEIINGTLTETNIVVPIHLITKDNVDIYGIDGWQ